LHILNFRFKYFFKFQISHRHFTSSPFNTFNIFVINFLSVFINDGYQLSIQVLFLYFMIKEKKCFNLKHNLKNKMNRQNTMFFLIEYILLKTNILMQ